MRDAVIFDMDGLLLDTERVALQAFKETCIYLDILFDQAVYNRCVGCTFETTKNILEDSIPSFPKEAFLSHWNALYQEGAIENPVPVKTGVKEFLVWLEHHNIPRAVATSTGLEKAKRKLLNADLIGHFSVLMTGDQVTNSKPHPEIYLAAAKKLEIRPENCLALEDSNNGVRAAHAANMLVFQIPDLVEPSTDVRKLGHSILPSMAHVHTLFESTFTKKQ